MRYTRAGEPDYLPWREPRVPRAFATAYGLPAIPTPEEMEQVAENWRPYRMWVTFLLRVMREEDTHEIAGKGGPPGDG